VATCVFAHDFIDHKLIDPTSIPNPEPKPQNTVLQVKQTQRTLHSCMCKSPRLPCSSRHLPMSCSAYLPFWISSNLVLCTASSAIQNLQKFDPFADTGDDSTSGSGGVCPPRSSRSWKNKTDGIRITFTSASNNATVARRWQRSRVSLQSMIKRRSWKLSRRYVFFSPSWLTGCRISHATGLLSEVRNWERCFSFKVINAIKSMSSFPRHLEWNQSNPPFFLPYSNKY
jgi:hypothetical protein